MKWVSDCGTVTLYCGDCRDILPTLPKVDAVVTDPPYGLSFMGKKWDYAVPGVDTWEYVLNALKPGGHLLAFAGTRTQHRMAVNIEDAGFEIRDMIAWVYGSGFPKSLDVSKAIDKAAGAEREVVGQRDRYHDGRERQNLGATGGEFLGLPNGVANITAPATPEARQWAGFGTALKPSMEPITVARKPLIGTVAENVLTHGTGAINVDGCRVGTETRTNFGMSSLGVMHDDQWKPRDVENTVVGRWPANLIHDGSDEVTGLLGDADRFFYCAKASKADRDEGCDGIKIRSSGACTDRSDGSAGLNSPRAGAGRTSGARNHHPTVKPTDLMRYLCRLVTPPSGTVLDLFMGSGSTGKAAVREGFHFIGIEKDREYFEIAKRRIQNELAKGTLFGVEPEQVCDPLLQEVQ